MATYKFQKGYIKEGTATFEYESAEALKGIQRTYSQGYLPFLDRVITNYSVDKTVVGIATNLYGRVQSAIRLIAQVRGLRGTRATSKDVSNLYSTMESINYEIRNLSKVIGESLVDPSILRQIEEESIYTLEGMEKGQEILQERLKKIPKGKPGVPGRLRTFAGTPFGGIARKYWYGLLGYTGAALWKTILAGRTRGKEKRRRGVETGFKDFVEAAKGRRDDFGEMEGIEEPSLIGGGPRGRSASSQSLMWFFDRGAYKARYTRELLAILKGRKVGIGTGIVKEGLSDDLIGGISGGLAVGVGSSLLKYLKGLSAITLAAGTVYLTYKVLKEPVKNLVKAVEDMEEAKKEERRLATKYAQSTIDRLTGEKKPILFYPEEEYGKGILIGPTGKKVKVPLIQDPSSLQTWFLDVPSRSMEEVFPLPDISIPEEYKNVGSEAIEYLLKEMNQTQKEQKELLKKVVEPSGIPSKSDQVPFDSSKSDIVEQQFR